MKTTSYLNILAVAVSVLSTISCKKDYLEIQPSAIVASPQEIAQLQTQLAGTWTYNGWKIDFRNVSGIPSESVIPVNASVIIDGSGSIKRFDYNARQLNALKYKLSGLNGINHLKVSDSVNHSHDYVISKLTSDSLRLTNTIYGKDTTSKLVVTETWSKPPAAQVDQGLFSVLLSGMNSAAIYYPGATVTVMVTPVNGTEKVVDQVKNVTNAYTFSYKPFPGDHIRLKITAADGSAPSRTLSPILCQATFKGIAIGNEWSYLPVRMSNEHQWDIPKTN